jgi:Peptidase S46
MKIKRFACALLGALLVLSSLGLPARADEGMWTFNNVPRAEIKKRYGFDVTDAFLKHLQLASVRFNNGGSGSFVSPNGLVLTNYHIVEDIVGELSTPQKDYAKTGFLARTPAEEMKIPSLELNVLESIEDVTDRVNAAVKPGASAAEALAARRVAIQSIQDESTKATGLRSDVITLYQGGQYSLYRYHKYTDVRLVFVPEFQAAFFGGDPDNFNFPRFNIDMSLVRVYENGQPVHPSEYLKWSTAGAKEGDLTFVTGNPGSTSRLNTVANLEYLRDIAIPLLLRMLEHREAVLKAYMAQGEEQTRRAQNELNSIQNALKVYRGQLAGLKDPALMARKQKEEQALRQSIAADPRRQRDYGDAFDTIATARKNFAQYERDRRFLDLAAAFNTQLFQYARALVRYAAESAKPSAERLPEYADNRLPALGAALATDSPLYPDFEKMKLADSLAFMRDEYGATSPLVQRVLKGETPEARAAELIDGTRLKDASFRAQLFKGGAEAINASNDPMLELARSIDTEARAVRERYENEVVGPERNAYAKIAHALFETEGTKLYPDATFTLRLSYGAVKGYNENGHHVAPFTTLGGLYERAAEHKYQFPYNLPQRWLDRKSALDLKTPFNFVTTNDIIGGNSGSPTVNKNGELVGLIFDGNIQSLVGNFIYDESVNRAISVDSRGMLEVMRKMFDATELVTELTGQSKSQTAGVRH